MPSDKVILKSGEIGTVESIIVEELDEPVKVYNFEVEEWHTYFVSEIGVLVHNTCFKQTKPNQVHHFSTNKSKKYTKQFEDITNKYGLDLDDAWNKESMPHQGRHPYAYHYFMLHEMEKIDSIAGGDVNKFLKLYDQLKNQVMANQEMLYKNYWINK